MAICDSWFDRIPSVTIGTIGENIMERSITKLHASYSIAKREPSGLSTETRQLVTLGRRHYWPFQLLGRAPMIQEPVRLGDWLLVPAQDDSSKIPERALARIQAIFAAGIRPQGFVLVHEAPKLLKAPVTPKEQPKTHTSTKTSTQTGSDLAKALGTGFAAAASMIFPMVFFVVAAALSDPILVAVTEDGYWIEIDRWYTE
jgi:hypothetical protein